MAAHKKPLFLLTVNCVVPACNAIRGQCMSGACTSPFPAAAHPPSLTQFHFSQSTLDMSNPQWNPYSNMGVVHAGKAPDE